MFNYYIFYRLSFNDTRMYNITMTYLKLNFLFLVVYEVFQKGSISGEGSFTLLTQNTNILYWLEYLSIIRSRSIIRSIIRDYKIYYKIIYYLL